MNFDRQNEISNVNDIDINNNINMFDPNQMSNQMMMPNSQMGMMMNPVIEPMRERVVQRTIIHEVPHVCPTRTRIINNHVFSLQIELKYLLSHFYRVQYNPVPLISSS